jgi:DNA-binding CsgD family transcriptional regulator
MASTDSALLSVIDNCYAGVLDENAWRSALGSIAALVNGSGTLVFAMSPSTRTVFRHDVVGFDPEAVATYNAQWAAQDVRVAAGLLSPVGVPQTEETLLPARVLRKSAIYNDYLLRVDAPHLLSAWLHRAADRVVALSIQGTRHRGAFSVAERERLAVVLPHVTRAIELKDKLSSAASVGSSLLELADSLPFGILVISADLRIQQASARARQILAAGDGVQSAGPYLTFLSSEDRKAFAGLMTATPSRQARRDELLIKRRHSRLPLSVLVTPVRADTETWMTASKQWLVAIAAPETNATIDAGLIARYLGLSPAECRVVSALVKGLSPEQIAQSLGTSIHTVRTQIKQAYAKTGTASQRELIALLLAHGQ